MSSKILIIEDEYRIRGLLCDYLKREGYELSEAEDGEAAIDLFKNDNFDLIILDIMIPKIDGWEVCKNIRSVSTVPIIMLTAKSEESDKLLGYELGADDYITKPFSPKLLVAKVKSILKRMEGNLILGNKTKQIGGIIINESSHEVSIDNKIINLSPKEYDLLLYFVLNKGIVLSRDKLLDNIWGVDYDGDLRTVDTHVKRLREKLENKADFISTVRGSGYLFEVKK